MQEVEGAVDRCFKRWFRGKGLHDVFAYECPKMVWIRDARLGLMYYVALAAIVWYIVIEVAVNLVWLDFWPPRFVVNLNLKEPVINDCNPLYNDCLQDLLPTKDLQYCCHDECQVKPDPKSNIEGRCLCPGRHTFSYDCNYDDGLRNSEILDFGLFVITKKTAFQQRWSTSCNEDHGCRKLWMSAKHPQAGYTADIERFSISIDHNVFQEEIGIFQTARGMEGFLEVGSGTEMQKNLCETWPDAVDKPYKGAKTKRCPCYIKPKVSSDHHDVFEVGTMLAAMGVNIDEGPHMSTTQKSIRSEGMTVTLEVEYFNTAPWRGVLDTTGYVYRLSPSPKSSFKKETLVFAHYRKDRLIEVQHGLMISVVAGGQLGSRNLLNVMCAATTVLALVTITELTMRKIVMILMGRRAYYYDYMYQISGDFGYIPELERMKPEQIKDALQRRKLDTNGSPKECIYRLLENGWKPRQKKRGNGEIEMSERRAGDNSSSEDEAGLGSSSAKGKADDSSRRLSMLDDIEDPLSREELADRIRDGILQSERKTIVLQQNMSDAVGSSDHPVLDEAPADIGMGQSFSAKQKRLQETNNRLAKLEAKSQERKARAESGAPLAGFAAGRAGSSSEDD